ncbi:uncharacterized protein LOC101202960 isoform X1 [Cucumis sativus]|nr:uncharacterized protein LOC101202960 isoform X1 [Cucumis sativus]
MSLMEAAMAFDPILDYSKTHRIILLVDLNPLLHIQSPSSYLIAITSTAKILLSFLPFSSSTLFSFRFFFSSLSPLLSSSKLRNLIPSCPLSLPFDHPTVTFDSLSNAIDLLLKLHQFPLCEASELMASQASWLAASMRQLLHDYTWNSVIEDLESASESFDCLGVRKNLVVLFSPFSELVGCLPEFLGVAVDDECVKDQDLFSRRFHELFEGVNTAFSQSDIQFSWINVSHESTENRMNNDELKEKYSFLKSGIRNLGWGFCSMNSIVLGSALLPFGLIYPKIGLPLRNLDIYKFQKKVQARLCLEILDRSEKPLECKFCNLELFEWKTLPENRCNDRLLVPGGLKMRSDGYVQRKVSLELLGDGGVKLNVKAVQKCRELVSDKVHLSYPFLVLESSETPLKIIQGSNGKFFADEVLEMMALELDECKMPKPIPFFELLMSFLYEEGYWALVSISNANGGSHLGILKPFMVSSALLFVIDKEFYPFMLDPNNEDMCLEEMGTAEGNNTCKPGGDLNKSCNMVDFDASLSVKCSQDGDGKMKAVKKSRQSIQNFTWADFCKVAYEHGKIDLENAYFGRYCNSSKKLKFFKSWVKQIRKSTLCGLLLPEKLQLKQDSLIKKDDGLVQLQEESKEPATSSGQENSLAKASETLAEATIDHHLETCDDFFNNLSNKIQQGLESEVVDLGALAERLVSSAIYWLSEKHEVQGGTSDDQPIARKFDSSISCSVATKLNKLLLREPEDLATKPKIHGLSFDESSLGSAGQTSEHIVREHELQIFFRMEILRSLIILNISESMKQKFVKDICLLLETIQCHLEGGFFGDWSIKNYVGKIIKSRYGQSLGEVVHRIYEKMDLLLFVDENKSTNHPLFSEDSNNSWRGNLLSDEVGDNYSSNDPVSVENKAHQNDNEKFPGLNNVYTSKLIKAQEMRERARRFGSFTSWAPDLHRVWAPKQTKARKPRTNHLKTASKRKYSNRESNDLVCETPEKSQSFQRENRDGDGNQSCRSVSKALFTDIDS